MPSSTYCVNSAVWHDSLLQPNTCSDNHHGHLLVILSARRKCPQICSYFCVVRPYCYFVCNGNSGLLLSLRWQVSLHHRRRRLLWIHHRRQSTPLCRLYHHLRHHHLHHHHRVLSTRPRRHHHLQSLLHHHHRPLSQWTVSSLLGENPERVMPLFCIHVQIHIEAINTQWTCS